MAVYSDPPTDVKVNSYVSLDLANYFNVRALNTASWDAASQTPDAREYLVNDPGGTLIIGSTSIPVDGGKGGWTDGNEFTFGDPGTGVPVYKIDGTFPEGSTSITIAAPGLVAPVPGDNVPLNRLTPNAKETALIYATYILDYQMCWFGAQRYTSRGSTGASLPQQNLKWPRSGTEDAAGYPFPSDVFPEPLQRATALFANYVLSRDLSVPPELLGLGFSKAEIPGPIKVEVSSLDQLPQVSDMVLRQLVELGELCDSAAAGVAFSTLGLIRA
jgi:hypothetical protein